MIPLWVKIGYTLMTLIIIVIYLRKYGAGNLLWFSDIALIVTVPALWLENNFLASMMAVGVLMPEVLWNLSYFTRLLTGKRVTGITDYMFEPDRPLYLKLLSLFHVPLPIVLVYLVWKLGYVEMAVVAQMALILVVLPISYFFVDPQRNVNWVWGIGGEGYRQKRYPPLVFLGIIMLVPLFIVVLPTHLALSYFFGIG